MSNKDTYARWLNLKQQFQKALLEDERIQELAKAMVGIKPQGTAVEVVARVYAKYCQLFNQMCDCYDQMGQVQRLPYMKKVIDALTCRILEVKRILEEVEVFEYTYPDNALQQMLIIPQDIEILCPFFYPYEIREAEKQYIIDEIFSGNRIGDPPLTQSQQELIEQQKREEEERLEEEKQAEIKRLMALGIDIVSEHSEQITDAEKEANRLREEYETHVFNIQRMERSRIIAREYAHKKNKDENLYLVLTGLKKPPAREYIRTKATVLIQTLLRKYMYLKREHLRERTRKEMLDMYMYSYKEPSAKIQMEKVKQIRREFRRKYQEKWLEANVKEKARVLRLREGNILEDISDEIRQWFSEWFSKVRVFDEYPWPDEGGSILVVRGETFSIPEYLEWKELEEKRIKAAAGKEKTAQEIKEEKAKEREEKKKLAAEAREKEKKRIADYKKSRMNPANDPGVYLTIGEQLEDLQAAWAGYQGQWKDIDEPEPNINAIKGHIMQLVTETAYQNINLELRPIVDEAMKLELAILKQAMIKDYASAGMKPPITLKRKKPKKKKNPKPDKLSPAEMFQMLADEGIVRRYPHITLDDYWGDRNYAAADTRAILWTPQFPPACISDVKEQVRNRCILTLGADCPNISRTQLLVGPKGYGKKSLVYAVATETNALLIDLSPFSVFDKFPGPKNLKTMFTLINKISRIMQPTVILVDDADKLFYKKVPKEEKMFDPTRLSRDFFKELIKPITQEDKIIVIGTASEPWLSAKAKMIKVFPNTIMIPVTDYGSISYTLTQMLMGYHGVDRDFNVHSVAQALRGYNLNTIKKAVEKLVSGKRLAMLAVKPLEPVEVLYEVMGTPNVVCMDSADTEMYQAWYLSYSSWGEKYIDYMILLEAQYNFKLKADKKKAKG